MALEKAKKIHASLVKAASKFLSPSLKQYFVKKADREFDKISNRPEKDVHKYIEKQKDLKSSLDRVSGIYNTYRDKTATL